MECKTLCASNKHCNSIHYHPWKNKDFPNCNLKTGNFSGPSLIPNSGGDWTLYWLYCASGNTYYCSFHSKRIYYLEIWAITRGNILVFIFSWNRQWRWWWGSKIKSQRQNWTLLGLILTPCNFWFGPAHSWLSLQASVVLLWTPEGHTEAAIIWHNPYRKFDTFPWYHQQEIKLIRQVKS